jgi:uncharacterized membrane protein
VATLISVLLFIAGLHLVAVLNAVGRPVNMGTAISPLLGVMFIVIGNFMGKIRRNYMFGVRTPWTLASDRAWNKTHRLGGKLFVASGALILVSGLLASGEIAFYVMFGSLMVTVAVLLVYSYLVWKNDPDAHVAGQQS